MSHRAFDALRRAATLAHSVPAIRVRVRHDDRVVVDVAPQGTPLASDTAKAVTPCGFRAAVAQAWERHRSGEQLGFCDLPFGAEPAIDLGLPPCGRTFPGEIHRVPLPGRYLYVFATTLAIDRCRHRADHHLCDVAAPPPGLWGVGLRADEATDVTLVYAELAADCMQRSEPATLELLQALLTDLSVRQLLEELEGHVANG